MAADDFKKIGNVVGVHGVKGTIKAAGIEAAFSPGDEILLRCNGRPGETFAVKWSKPHKSIFLTKLKGLRDRTKAESFIGCGIWTENALVHELDADTYFWEDLIGISVSTVDGKFLGKVDSIIETVSNDVYVVKNDDDGNEILIPAIERMIKEISTTAKTMVVDIPEGL